MPDMLIQRRNLLRGLFAAPAIIAIDRLMPIKAIKYHKIAYGIKRISVTPGLKRCLNIRYEIAADTLFVNMLSNKEIDLMNDPSYNIILPYL